MNMDCGPSFAPFTPPWKTVAERVTGYVLKRLHGLPQKTGSTAFLQPCSSALTRIILTASWLFSRYRMCPPDKILIVFGKVGTGQPAKCYHGGSTFVLPVLQSYS